MRPWKKSPTLPPELHDKRVWLLVLAITLFVSGVLLIGAARPKLDPIGYDDTATVTGLLEDLEAGRIDRVTFYDDVNQAVVDYHDAENSLVSVPDAYVEQVMTDVVDARVDLAAGAGTPEDPVDPTRSASQPWRILGLALIFSGVGIGVWLLVRVTHPGAGTRDGAAQSRRKKHSGLVAADQVGTRFADVAGAEEAVDSLAEMVAYLRDPSRFTRLGARPPRGALLVGPPGTGKTLLARAVAGEAGVAFLQVSGSDFVEKYVGVGARRIRELFAAARRYERAIVFIDELDAIARRRSSGEEMHNNAESENTLIALLTELDGFADRGNVVILGATNRPDVLDPAVTRPGRLDRRIEVPNPDRRGREQILRVHTRGKPVAGNVDLVALARRTAGFSGAQLAAVVNEACMVAARTDQDQVTDDCFHAAVATVAMGRARTSALVTDHDREVTAWHEAGHTVAAFLIPEADDPVSVSIVPRGPAGGVTWMTGSDDLFLPRRKAHAQLVVAMAGRAAEEVLLDGEYTQGASGDLNSATQLATAMVTQYGMSKLGYAVRAAGSANVVEIVDELLHDAHHRAAELLARHEQFVSEVAAELLEHETLSLGDISRVAERCGVDRRTRVALPATPSKPRPAPESDTARTPGDVVVPFPVPSARRGVRLMRLAVAAVRSRRSGRTPPVTG